MQSKRYVWLLLICLAATGCGGDKLTFDFPESTPPTDTGPPPPKPTDLLSTTPPTGMTGRIVYLSEVNNEFFSIHLFLTLPDGSNAISLFENSDPFSYTGPSWSPNGDKIVVASNLQGNAEWDIYTVNADGSGIKHIVAGPSNGDFAPAWSPDGSQIAFQSTTDDATGFDIYLYDIPTETTTNLTNSVGADELPSWSPDGTRVLFQTTTSSGTNLWVIGSDGSGLTALTTGTRVQNSAGMFSPDGQSIVFESTQHQPVSETITIGDFEIYVMDADGSNSHRLTVGVGENDAARFPTWSPDGNHIAFEFHDFTINQLFGISSIAVMNADGSNIYLLKDQPVKDLVRFPRWGP